MEQWRQSDKERERKEAGNVKTIENGERSIEVRKTVV